MKRVVALMLTVVMAFSVVACGGGGNEKKADGKKDDESKIGLLVATVSQNEEEYRKAEEVQKKFGKDKVVIQTYPDNHMKEQETTIANALALAADPNIKAIVFVQAVNGVSAAIDKVREKREDMLFIAGTPSEDPTMIADKADFVLQSNEIDMGVGMAEQAKEMGAKTFIHYSFPRHMSMEMLVYRRDVIKKTCKELGIEFLDATAPDPQSDAGISGTQQFMLEDVPRKIEEYGKDTVFYATNCSMQEPLIKSVVDNGGMYVLPCCPSPYHGFPGALGISIPEDKKGNVDFICEEITKVIAEKGNSGRVTTWKYPMNQMFIECGAQYAFDWMEGKTDGKQDFDHMKKIFSDYQGVEEASLSIYDNPTTEVRLENFWTVMLPYVKF